MMKFLKVFALSMVLLLIVSSFAACRSKGGENNTASTSEMESEVVSLESGSLTQNEDTEGNKETSQPEESFNSDGDELEILTIPQNIENPDDSVSSDSNPKTEEETLPTFDIGDIEDIIEGNTGAIELPFVPAE